MAHIESPGDGGLGSGWARFCRVHRWNRPHQPICGVYDQGSSVSPQMLKHMVSGNRSKIERSTNQKGCDNGCVCGIKVNLEVGVEFWRM